MLYVNKKIFYSYIQKKGSNDMPKGFNNHEKKVIKEALIEQGKQLFSIHGLQKTSIQDITTKVGIAAGSFYKFYQSKEELYFEVLEQEEAQIKNELLQLELGDNPKQTVKITLLRMITSIEKSTIIQQLYLENNLEYLFRKLPPEKLESHFDKDSDFSSILIQKWEKQGLQFTESPKMIASILRSLVFLSFQKEKIGELEYPKTIEFLINHTVNGLIKEE